MNETTTETELGDTPHRLHGRESVLGLDVLSRYQREYVIDAPTEAGRRFQSAMAILQEEVERQIKTAPCVGSTESGTPNRKVIQNHEHSEYSTV